MCTVSILALPDRRTPDGPRPFRMLCNRDESPRRPAATPPRVEPFGPRTAILPRDPLGGGTWIAASDAGLVLTLLNYHPPRAQRPPINPAWRSRGEIIPALLHCGSTAEALDAARLFDPTTTAPYRLVIVDGRERGLVVCDARSIRIVRRPHDDTPIVFASSGLGDDVVTPPRADLFDEMVVALPAAQRPAAQQRYHRHRWPDRGEVSVCMRRAGAETVSCTGITVADDAVTLEYLPHAPDRDGSWTSLQIPRNTG